MSSKAPPTRRTFRTAWDEISYLYDKLLYWFYDREDSARALPFAKRLERLLKKAPDADTAIMTAECRSLIAELRGDLRGAIRHRENEVRLIKRLHQISRNTPSWERIARHMGYSDLSDRLDLLAILYHDAGDLGRAIATLRESKALCARHDILFDGQDLLEEYLNETRLGSEAGADGRGQRKVAQGAGRPLRGVLGGRMGP
jgi:hypothetical protein